METISAQVNTTPRVAPPDKAASILQGLGYPVGAKLLRTWYKSGRVPGVNTGHRVLLNIQAVVDFIEAGDNMAEPIAQHGAVRRIEG